MEIFKKNSTRKPDALDKNGMNDYDILEDGEDLFFLEQAAARATKKAFEKAKNSSAEILVVENGKLIRKKSGQPDQIISEHKERKVEVGKTISL